MCAAHEYGTRGLAQALFAMIEFRPQYSRRILSHLPVRRSGDPACLDVGAPRPGLLYWRIYAAILIAGQECIRSRGYDEAAEELGERSHCF